MNDDDLKNAYRSAMEEQHGPTPGFERTVHAEGLGSGRSRIWQFAASFAVVAILAIGAGLWFTQPDPAVDAPKSPEEIVLLEIDQESVATNESWDAPTDFLLAESGLDFETGSLFDELDEDLNELKEL